MASLINTELLFAKLNEEKSTGELTPLPKEFYFLVDEFVENLEKTNDSDPARKQIENTRRMAVSLKEKRKQKLLIYLAYGKPLPQPMPEAEEALYNEIRRILSRDESKDRVSKLKVTADVPEVFTAAGKKIGPYKLGEVVEVPDKDDYEFMLKNKIGEQISQ
ncbi:Uncharacterised protein [uncultured archaeon]|nr:Uncharacterised protein [uncultured archaeon]